MSTHTRTKLLLPLCTFIWLSLLGPTDSYANLCAPKFRKVDLAKAPLIEAANKFKLREVLLNYVRGRLRLRPGGVFNIDLRLPETAPTSEALVYIVTENGIEIAALKVFFDKDQTYSREIEGVKFVEALGLKQSDPVSILDQFKIKIGLDTFDGLIFSMATTADLEVILRSSAQSDFEFSIAKKAVQKTAMAIAELHIKTQDSAKNMTLQPTARLLHEQKKLKTSVNQEGVLRELNRKGWLTDAEEESLTEIVDAKADSILKVIPHAVAVVHGDFHPGNVFYNSLKNTSQFIDLQTLSWSLLPDGHLDVNADVSKFYEGIASNGLAGGLSRENVRELQKLFLDQYLESTGFVRAKLLATLDFYRLRYAMVNLATPRGAAKFTPWQRKLYLNYLIDSFGIHN